jgi:hypothetical protein
MSDSDHLNFNNENNENNSFMINQNTYSISLIDGYKTSYEKTKIPFKKTNFKNYFYKKRINYGKLSMIGLAKNNLRFLPELEIESNADNDSISNLVCHPLENDFKQNLPPLDEDFYNKILFCSDLTLYTKESKREIKLKKMLEEKICKLMYLSKKNNL